MALTPLSNVQKATVVALVEARRLDVVPAMKRGRRRCWSLGRDASPS